MCGIDRAHFHPGLWTVLVSPDWRSYPPQGPWRILPHCLHSRPPSPLWYLLSNPSWDIQPLPALVFVRPLLRVSVCPSARLLRAVGRVCGELRRTPAFRAVPGQQPMDRGELTHSTDCWAQDISISSPLCTGKSRRTSKSFSSALGLTDGHTEFQRGLGRKCRRQRFVLIPFIVLHPSQTLCSDRAGQALGAGAGPQAGSPGSGRGSHSTRGS